MELMYDNPENIDDYEILRKLRSNMSFGSNRNKRFNTLMDYGVNQISKEEWIKKYCNKN
jgi:hypothetical protein